MAGKAVLPKWKADEVLYCSDCEIIMLKKNAKNDGGLFSNPGFYCVKCEKQLGEIEKKEGE